jgi:GntR family transcriptional repressor for pyruvate dehydrogenase complex
MAGQFTPVVSGIRLSDQVAQQLMAEVQAGRFAVGEKLPAEARLVEQFQVSRTVVREAVSRLKSLGLVDSRQGSGVFVSAKARFEPLRFEASEEVESREAVVQMAEVRRALEAEAASLAAQRRSGADLKAVKQAVQALDRAVRNGGDGIEEDLQFHSAIAYASHNPFLIGTLKYLSQFIRQAIAVTRANEARRADFTQQVREEHAALVDAIEAADSAAARRAAGRHMKNAARRIEMADPAFWRQEGARLADLLRKGP